MDTLVRIAKSLGIKPTPKETHLFHFQNTCCKPIYTEMEKRFGRRPKRMGGITSFQDIYILYKYLETERSWNKAVAAQYVRSLKTTAKEGIKIFDQYNAPAKVGEDGSFIWHSARKQKPLIERFQIDLKMDSPNMDQMWKDLDDFIIKHNASFKVVDLDGKKRHDRTDTLNVYMTEEITPEIANELYTIIHPYLEPKYDEFLAGIPVKLNKRNIKGFKYGPEPINVGDRNRTDCANYIKEVAERTLPPFFAQLVAHQGLEELMSLGQLTAKIQTINLIYYLAGQEGKSPFQLDNQFADPRKKQCTKVIDIADAATHSKTNTTSNTSSLSQNGSKSSPEQKSLWDKLKREDFTNEKGTKGIRYLDQNGDAIIIEAYYNNCTIRFYSNGLRMYIMDKGNTIIFVDAFNQSKNVERLVFKKGQGWTDITRTTGELVRKYEMIRKAGLLYKPSTESPQRSTALKGHATRHSVNNAIKITRLSSKKVPSP